MNNSNDGDLSLYFNSIKEQLEKKHTMSQAAFELWFSDLHLISLDTDKIVFATADEMKRKFISNKCMSLLSESVNEALGFNPKIDIICDGIRNLQFTMPNERFKKSADNGNDTDSVFSVNQQTDSDDDSDRSFGDSPAVYGLNSEYTFDNFVVGSSNQFAHACSVAVSEDPGGSHDYNPLFIYGPSGLGKTHLMYAIANKVHEVSPEKTIICTKSEDFLNEMISHLTNRTMSKFREKYRKADMLLIDDVQFISGKNSIQEEFFHTFDTLYEAKKQIVVTSDRPPKEMYTLEERIKTRFAKGMLADVQPPEYELRLAILRKKAEKGNLKVPNDVLSFLAERLNSNIREIEGAVKKIGAVAFLSGKPITLEMVKSSIPEYFSENKPVAETVDSILEVTARKFDVSVEDILGKKRTKDIKTARNVAMYVIRKILGLSLPSIGKMMDRDYSTVHSNIHAVEAEIQTNDKLNNDIIEIITEVKD